VPAALRKTVEDAAKIYNAAIDEHQAWIDTTLVPAAKADFRAGAEVFDTQLGFTLQSTLTRADIRQRAETAITSVRQTMYGIARKVLSGKVHPQVSGTSWSAVSPSTPSVPSGPRQRHSGWSCL
jgi:hypothetical protein